MITIRCDRSQARVVQTPDRTKIRFTIEIPYEEAASAPSLPAYNHTREDGYSDPCPECLEARARHKTWQDQILDRLDTKGIFFTLDVSGYCMSGDQYTKVDIHTKEQTPFNGWVITGRTPDGSEVHVIVPEMFKDELYQALNPRYVDTDKTRYDRLVDETDPLTTLK